MGRGLDPAERKKKGYENFDGVRGHLVQLAQGVHGGLKGPQGATKGRPSTVCNYKHPLK